MLRSRARVAGSKQVRSIRPQGCPNVADRAHEWLQGALLGDLEAFILACWCVLAPGFPLFLIWPMYAVATHLHRLVLGFQKRSLA